MKPHRHAGKLLVALALGLWLAPWWTLFALFTAGFVIILTAAAGADVLAWIVRRKERR